MRSATSAIGAIGLLLLAQACSDNPNVTIDRDLRTTEERRDDVGQLFGGDIVLFSTAPDRDVDGGETGVAVNSYLWRASLDTVSFMPISSADPFGGVILTDWYTPPESPEERFKLNVFVLTRQLRADGVRVSVFKQSRDASGEWVDAAVDTGTGTAIEDAILSRARQLRVATAG
ncbi:MAG: DUF3576 domain-containing protein [Alphaproteobacteria bacterium]